MKTINSYRRYIIVGIAVIALVLLTGCNACTQNGMTKPINGFSSILDILIWPIAGLMYILGKSIAFNQYAVMIVLATIIIRTVAWPVYSKSNDMTLKMKLMQPELNKIEAKYEGRDDESSQKMKQQEQMMLYQKYGVGASGCIAPFIQFPLFMAFYETIQRIPYTINSEEASYPLNFGQFNHMLFGVDLFGTIKDPQMADPTRQKIGVWILIVLVVLSQILSQVLLQVRQKKEEKKYVKDVPDYRKPQPTGQQKANNVTMQVMMYAMAILMGVFVYRSAVGLGLYWLTGNLYTLLQSSIGSKTQAKRLEKLKKQF